MTTFDCNLHGGYRSRKIKTFLHCSTMLPLHILVIACDMRVYYISQSVIRYTFSLPYRLKEKNKKAKQNYVLFSTFDPILKQGTSSFKCYLEIL